MTMVGSGASARARMLHFSVLFLPLVMMLAGCQGVVRPTSLPAPTTIYLPPTSEAGPAVAIATPRSGPRSTEATPRPHPTSTPAAGMREVPATQAARLAALGLRPYVTLRAAPSSDAPVVAQVPGSQVRWVQGRSADGQWLWVLLGEDGAQGWAERSVLRAFGDSGALEVLTPVALSATPSPSATAAARSIRSAPRLSGQIVFQVSSGGDIYLVNADGSDLRRLTDGLDPALSPDGGRVAYARWGAQPGIFVLDLASGVERRVASANRPRSPTWSPDGDQLAFVHLVRTVLCRVSPFGCLPDAELRARFGGQDCLVTPRGRICIADLPQRELEQTGIVRVSEAGGDWLDLSATADAQSVTWHPQRDTLLFRGGGGLQETSAGNSPQMLVRNAAMGSPAWAPDGSRMAVQIHLHDNTDIFLLDASGQTLARLTSAQTGAGRAADSVSPAWSPDGRFILFLSNRSGSWRLYLAGADGSNQAPFLPELLGDLAFVYDFAAERVAHWGR